MMNNFKPFHDSSMESHCEFLGTIVIKNITYDLYFKFPNRPTSFDEVTIIARYGIDEKYMSGMCFGKHAFDRMDFTHPLAYAYAMIKDRTEAQEQIRIECR